MRVLDRGVELGVAPLTASELSGHMGLDPDTVLKIVTEHYRPRDETVASVATFLDADVAEIKALTVADEPDRYTGPLCECGCGEHVAPGSRFRHGHWARTRERTCDGPAKALCLCGCGERPKTSRSRYRQGHASRRPEAPKPPRSYPPPEIVESTCSICGKTFSRRVNYGRGVYCGQRCQRIGNSSTLSPKKPLGKFLFERFRASGLSRAQFAKTIGIGPGTLRRQCQDRLPIDKTYAALRLHFGDDLPESESQTDHMRADAQARGRRNIAFLHSPEARRKVAESLKGQKHSPERVAKMVATQTASGHLKRLSDAGRKAARSPQGRAERSFWNHLRWTPKPTVAERRRWAEEVGERIGLSPASVLVIWAEYEQRHGIATSARGPKTLEKRHRLVAKLMAEWPRTQAGKPKRGFFPAAAIKLSEAGDHTDGDSLRTWYKHHVKEGRCEEPTLIARNG